MKSILEFNLPEEREEFNDAMKGQSYHAALDDIFDHMRRMLKHGDLPEKDYELIAKLRDELWEIYSGYIED